MHQHECGECGKMFIFATAILYRYTPEKADCLNGGEHNWEPTFTYPIEHTKGYCTHCWLERKATPDDMAAAILEREVVISRVIARMREPSHD